MTRADSPLMRITVTGADGRAIVDCVEPFSPYVIETIVDHARGAGAGVRTEVTLPSATPPRVRAAIAAELTRRRGPGAGVRVG